MKNCGIIFMNWDAEWEQEGSWCLVSAPPDYFGIYFRVFIAWSRRVVLEWGGSISRLLLVTKIVLCYSSRFHIHV